MAIKLEIVGLKDQECSPFPCDDDRSCGLTECYPTGKFVPAFHALQKKLKEEYGDKIEINLTLIDEVVPIHIQKILETYYPPLPIILINGELAKIGSLSLNRIHEKLQSNSI